MARLTRTVSGILGCKSHQGHARSGRSGLPCVGLALCACAAAPQRPGQDEPPEPAATRPQPLSSPSTTTEHELDHEPSAETPAEATPPTAQAEQGFYPLQVPGFQDALVWDPGGHHEALPLWVVAHGAGGNPEWHCQYWSQVVADSAFLLCLRGKPMRAGASEFYFPEHLTLGRLLDASVIAFDARYAARRTTDYNGYIGYSQGATMGALMLPDRAARFALVLLSEGGYDQWTAGRAQKFAKGGGHAVFFACGTQSCNKGATRTLRYFADQNVAARLGHAPGAGHTPAGPVGEVSVAGLAWLLEQARVAAPTAEQ